MVCGRGDSLSCPTGYWVGLRGVGRVCQAQISATVAKKEETTGQVRRDRGPGLEGTKNLYAGALRGPHRGRQAFWGPCQALRELWGQRGVVTELKSSVGVAVPAGRGSPSSLVS